MNRRGRKHDEQIFKPRPHSGPVIGLRTGSMLNWTLIQKKNKSQEKPSFFFGRGGGWGKRDRRAQLFLLKREAQFSMGLIEAS